MARKRSGLGRGLSALIPNANISTPQTANLQETEKAVENENAVAVNENPAAAVKTVATEVDKPEKLPLDGSITAEKPDFDAADSETINAAKFAQEVAQSVEAGGRPADVFFASGGTHTPKGGSARELLMPRQRKQKVKSKGKTAADSAENIKSTVSQEATKAGEEKTEAAEKTVPAENAALAENVSHSPASPAADTSAVTSGKHNSSAAANSPKQKTAQDSPTLREIPGVSFAVIPVEKIQANQAQPRTIFNDQELKELADSIKQVGLLQPIVVRESKTGFELVMGERRLRASKLAGITEVPAIIRGVADNEMLREALLENLHRVELSPLDEAAAYQQLMSDFGCTQAELSQRIARSRSQIANMLRLLRLPASLQAELNEGRITTGHARALLSLKKLADQERVCAQVIKEELSVRQLERLVAKLNANQGEDQAKEKLVTPTLPARYQKQADAWSKKWADSFSAKVQVKAGKKKGSGKIVIDFADEATLAQITQLLFND